MQPRRPAFHPKIQPLAQRILGPYLQDLAAALHDPIWAGIEAKVQAHEAKRKARKPHP